MRIGVFDSGVGGLTVLAVLTKRFPYADFVYFGDNANLPYGTKSPTQIRRLCGEAARFFKRMEVDLLVVACNTASSLALGVFRISLPAVPVFGVVEPGALAAVDAAERVFSEVQESHKASRKGPLGGRRVHVLPIAVFATRATVASHAYEREIKRQAREVGVKLQIIEQECPLLVPMIEEGWVNSNILKETLRVYTSNVKKKYRGFGIAILGCTHYPWIKKQFQDALPGWTVVSSADRLADQVDRWIRASSKNGAPRKKGVRQFKFSDQTAVPEFALALIKKTYGQKLSRT